MAGLTVLRGRVVRIEGGLPFVEVRELGAGYAFGPLEVATPSTFELGSRVLVAAIGDSREDLVVVGVIGADVAPTGPAGGDLQGSYPDPTLRPGAVTAIGDARYSQLAHLHDDRYSQLAHLHDDRYARSTKLAQNGATSTWIRVATVSGGHAAQGHAVTLLVSGQGSIASAKKVTQLVTFGQRNSNAYAFQARQLGEVTAGGAWSWRVKQISEFVFELWANRWGYDAEVTVQVLAATTGATLNLDSVTTSDPGGTAQPAAVQVDLVDAAAATASLRTLGTGALQAAAGNHLHDDQYTPTSQMVLATGAHAETARPEAYPVGFSTFGTSATGWPETLGTVSTEFHSVDRAVQRYTAKVSGKVWTRTASSGETSGWTAWRELSASDHLHDDRYVQSIEASTMGGNPSRRGHNLALFSESGTNLAGDLVIQTNIPFNNTMTRLSITGYNYSSAENNIDLEVSFYPYSVGPSFYNYSALNKGSVEFSNVRLARRVSDGKVAIFLTLRTGSWQYPKLTVDGLFGSNPPTDAELGGWTVSRLTATTGYDLLTAAPVTSLHQRGLPALSVPVGGNIGAGSHLPNDSVVRTTHSKTGIVVIPAYASTMHVSMSLMAHSDTNAQCHWDPQVSLNNGATSWLSFLGVNGTYGAVHNHAHPGTNLGFALSQVFDVRAARGATIALAVNGHNDVGSGTWVYVSNVLYSIQFML